MKLNYKFGVFFLSESIALQFSRSTFSQYLMQEWFFVNSNYEEMTLGNISLIFSTKNHEMGCNSYNKQFEMILVKT